MDYGKIVSRSANLVWQNKYLIVLGILASLGGGGGGNFFSGGGGGGGDGSGGNGQPFGEPGQLPEFGDMFPGLEEYAGLAVGIVIALVCIFLVIGLLIWAVSTIARGGLVAGVDTVESGGKSSFSQAWRAGWQRVWSLLGISLLPAIPVLMLLVVGVLAFAGLGGFAALFDGAALPSAGMGGLGFIMVALACIALPLALVLAILRTFAERACMLENLGVVGAYRRGTEVLTANLGQAIVLFLVQIIVGVVVAVTLFVPSLIAILCCFLWPLLLVVQGGINAFFSTLWTLAWRTWTGHAAVMEKAPGVA